MRSLSTRVRRSSLLVRFAVTSLVLVVVLGALMAQLLASMIARRGLESAKDAAVLTTTMAVQPLLRPQDLAQALPADKVAALDRAVHGSRRGTEIARIKIWHSDRELLYTADPHTASSRRASTVPSDELEEALEGEIEAEIISSSEEPDNVALLDRYGTLLEVYVPILYGDDPRPAGVFELYLPYEPVQASIRSDTTRAVGLLVLGLVVLWLGLFRVVATASRRLREESARSEHQALHDGLTGLANRALLDQELATAVDRADRRVALVLLDLDRFREVNDTLGHACGDKMLLEMAARLTTLAGPDDLVARLGGDEFAVLLRDVDGVESALVHAEVLRGALRAPMRIGGVSVALDARAGVSVHPTDAADGPALLRHADIAAEHAKRSHTGVCVYDRALDQHSTERLGMLAELGRAITWGELVLHYQPRCDLDGRVLGVEALVRWQHPRRGLLAPLDFVPVAERTGLVHPLTDVVLDMALAQARSWLDDGRPVPVAVNVSTRSLLQPGFAEKVLTALGAHGVPARLLGLEITETTIMEDPERAMTVLTRLADAGVRLAIDDFGTGYSSLAYLKALPVHELKIDRAFVAALTTSERDRVIVDSIIALGNRLGLDVVAEGVEDEATRAALAELGCGQAQGYLFGRPVPASDLRLGALAEAGQPVTGAGSRGPTG